MLHITLSLLIFSSIGVNSFEQEEAAGSDFHFVRDRIPVTSLVIGGGTKNVTKRQALHPAGCFRSCRDREAGKRTTAIKTVTNARFYEIKRDQDKIKLTRALGSVQCE